MLNHKQNTGTIHTVLADTVKGGDVVIIGDLVGVAATDGNGVHQKAVALKGSFMLPKDTSTFAQGAKVYWISADKKCTSTSSGNTLIGLAFAAAGTADTVVEVALTNSI